MKHLQTTTNTCSTCSILLIPKKYHTFFHSHTNVPLIQDRQPKQIVILSPKSHTKTPKPISRNSIPIHFLHSFRQRLRIVMQMMTKNVCTLTKIPAPQPFSETKSYHTHHTIMRDNISPHQSRDCLPHPYQKS